MSATGLNVAQRARARRRVAAAALTFYKQAQYTAVYSQGADRFSGIRLRKRAYKDQYPPESDCSSSTTWMHWDGTRRYKLRDYVNGTGWLAGYTGTQQQMGKRVTGHMLPGDLVFYGNQGGGIAEHVAVYIGNGLVISHGGPGVHKLAWDYRPVNEVRRHIR